MENIEKFLSEVLDIPQSEISSFVKYYTKKKIPKGCFLLRAGEICTHTFFVEKGLLRMFSIDKMGKEHIIQFATENWLISDRSSLYFNEESKYYIDAVEDSEVISLSVDFFHVVMEKYQNSVERNEMLLHKHIRNLQNRVNSLIAETAEERYLKFIKMYPDVMLRVPQWMVASFLGITPESLSRVRKELAKKNFRPD